MSNLRTIAIVGAGAAGAKAAESLRTEGFDGRVVLFGAEPDPPYNRPELSKGVLQGTTQRDQLELHPATFYADQGIELRTSSTVSSIDLHGRRLMVGDREEVLFDGLLLATGARPRRLEVPGADLDGVLHLRDLRDADALRARAVPGAHAVVIGAGWIGAEVAASLRQAGVEVTLVELGQVPLERVVGREVGGVFADLHREHGVDLRTGVGLTAIEGRARAERVVIADGQHITCDFVVVGVGVVPRTELAEAAGLAVERGILVDEHLRTSASGVFAAGDVTNAHHALYEGRLHVEHWTNAEVQGPTAARSMLGREAVNDSVPFFWSDQYDVGMEYSGHAPAWDEVVLRGDPASRSFIAFYLAGGRVIAGVNVGVWDVAGAIQDLVRAGVPVDTGRLRDPDVPLTQLSTEPSVEGGRAPKASSRKGVERPAGADSAA